MSETDSVPEDECTTGPGRRAFLTGAAGVGLAAAGMTLSGATAAAATPRSAASPQNRSRTFVRVHRDHFVADGKTFRFGGTNTYYLHQQSHYMIDGSGQSYTPLQPQPYTYDDDAFDSLDYAVWKAGQLGLRLVLALTNNWPDYGGMQQYVKWFLDLPDDSYADAVNHDKFYTTESIKACYRAYARHVIRRRNPYTGLRYNEDPTIMTFELANEPRNRSDKTGAEVLAWAAEMSTWVKSLAPRQLVAVGDEGFYGDPDNSDYPYSNYEGNRWRDLVALPNVDYGTVHLYPGSWGETPASKPGTDPVAWGTTWITDHLTDGKRLSKPVVIEEYGLHVDASQGVPDEAARTAGYAAWTGAVESGGAGDQFWLLTSRVDDGSFYPDYDGFRIVWQNDATNPTNATAQMLSAHAKKMAVSS
jgi:mannan endo-1,4-beta-mannosidase